MSWKNKSYREEIVMAAKLTSWIFALLISFSTTSVVLADTISPDQPDASEEGFVAVDLNKNSINGKAHAIAAYVIVIGVLFLYS